MSGYFRRMAQLARAGRARPALPRNPVGSRPADPAAVAVDISAAVPGAAAPPADPPRPAARRPDAHVPDATAPAAPRRSRPRAPGPTPRP